MSTAAVPPASAGPVMSAPNPAQTLPPLAAAIAVSTDDPVAAGAVLADGGQPWAVSPVLDGLPFAATAVGRRLGHSVVAAFDVTAARIVAPPPVAEALAIIVVLDGALVVETPVRAAGAGRGEALCLRLDGPLVLTTPGCAALLAMVPAASVGALPAGFRLAGPLPADGPEIRLFTGHAGSVALVAPDGNVAVRETVGQHVADLVAPVIAGAAGPTGVAAARSDRLEAARRIIELGLGQPTLSVGRVARRIGISDRTLQKLFAASGTTFSAYLMDRRLDRARTQLVADGERRLAIRDVAYACGFSDAAHFSRAFRHRFGTTPSAFRAAPVPPERAA
jgi:AraC-like DNA-binding protein